MMSSALAFALLCLLSSAQSAPLDCNLNRPLDEVNTRELEGSWVLVADSVSDHSTRVETFRLNITILSEADLHYTRSMGQHAECIILLYNVTLEGSSFTFSGYAKSELSGHFFHPPCTDCLVMKLDIGSNINSEVETHLYLLSRRRELKEEELDKFRSQAECLNMPHPVVRNPIKELC